MTDLSRRSVLGLSAGALASLAGCIGGSVPGDGGTTEPTTDTTTTEDWHNYRQITLQAHETTPAEIGSTVLTPFDELDDTEQGIVVDAVANDGTTYTTYRGRPLADDSYVAYDGSYYAVRVSTADEREVTGHELKMETVPDGEHRATPENYEEVQADAVAFDDLLTADQEAFLMGLPDGTERRGANFTAQFSYVYESEDVLDSSAFVSEGTTYVEYEEEYFAVSFVGTEQVVKTTYEYALEPVAETRDAFDEVATERYATSIDEAELSADERGIFQTLVKEGKYERENPIPEALDSFTQWLYSHEPIPRTDYVYVSHEGTYYAIEVMEAVA